jgi:hypothetical protein
MFFPTNLFSNELFKHLYFKIEEFHKAEKDQLAEMISKTATEKSVFETEKTTESNLR